MCRRVSPASGPVPMPRWPAPTSPRRMSAAPWPRARRAWARASRPLARASSPLPRANRPLGLCEPTSARCQPTLWRVSARGLGACELTLGPCQSSLGACQEWLGMSDLRYNRPKSPENPVPTVRQLATLGFVADVPPPLGAVRRAVSFARVLLRFPSPSALLLRRGLLAAIQIPLNSRAKNSYDTSSSSLTFL